MSTESETTTRIEIRTDLTPPPQFRVIFVNDSVTTMEFVVDMLVSIFSYESGNAKQVTTIIHENGSAVVAVMPFELAEQKALEVTAIARSNGFPLNVKLEPNV